jgi:hypothetical protein
MVHKIIIMFKQDILFVLLFLGEWTPTPSNSKFGCEVCEIWLNIVHTKIESSSEQFVLGGLINHSFIHLSPITWLKLLNKYFIMIVHCQIQLTQFMPPKFKS